MQTTGSRRPKSFVSVPTTRLEVKFSNGLPSAYQIGTYYGKTRKNKEYKVSVTGQSDLLVLAAYNPAQPYTTRPALDSCRDAIAAINELNRAKHAAAKGGISAACLITAERMVGDNTELMSDEEAKRLKYAIERKATGASRAQRPVVSRHPLKVHDLSNLNKDMAHAELQTMLATQVPMAMGAPTQVFSFDTDANAYANYDNSHKKYFEGLIKKYGNSFAAEAGRFLSINMKKNIVVEVDEGSIPLLRKLKREEVTAAIKDAGKFITLNEMRGLFGLCKVEEVEDVKEREQLIKAWENEGTAAESKDDKPAKPTDKPKEDKK